MAHWPYNTPAWIRLRKVKLAQQPLCEVCMKRGRLVPANTVDHVVSINAGGHPFPTLEGLMSCCTSCHNSKTNAVDRKEGKGIAFKACDASGLPIDPSHPFYGGNEKKKDAIHPSFVGKPITPFKKCRASAYDRRAGAWRKSLMNASRTSL